MTGGGKAPIVSLGALAFSGDDFFSARGGETSVRRDPSSRGGVLVPSHSTTNLLSGLEQKLGDKDARLRQLEDRLTTAQRQLEDASEKLGELLIWNYWP